MKMEDLRAKTQSELQDLVVQLKRELMNLRFQKATGQMEATHRVRQARREVAQVKTVQRELAVKAS